jgi:hypothetical protein
LILKLTDAGLKLLGALALWIVGRWLSSFGLTLVSRSMEARQVDGTIIG